MRAYNYCPNPLKFADAVSALSVGRSGTPSANVITDNRTGVIYEIRLTASRPCTQQEGVGSSVTRFDLI